MGENQKIHPVVELEPPKMPLVPGGVPSNSEKDDPLILMQHNHRHPALAPRRDIPAVINPTHTPQQMAKKKKKSSCCCKCVCWTVSLLVLLLVIIGITCGILYLVFKPKLPNYSVNGLRISELGLNSDMSLYAKFNVRITAINPNKKIGIYYEKGSHLSVWYTNTKLCQGSIPRFYQGHQNTTKLEVTLTGETQYGSTLLAALTQEQRLNGRIPLDLKVDVPVSVKLGIMKLRKVRILGSCSLIVDSLSTNNLISIKASTCKFRMKL